MNRLFSGVLLIADDESEFSYDEKSENGPANWGKIHPEWRTCNTGKLQSPIDLLNKRVKVVSDLGRLRKYYKPSNTTLLNRGHDMMVIIFILWITTIYTHLIILIKF